MYPNPVGGMFIPNMGLPLHPQQMTMVPQSLHQLSFPLSATTAQMASMYSHLPPLPPPQDPVPPWLRVPVPNRTNDLVANAAEQLQQLTARLQMTDGDGTFGSTVPTTVPAPAPVIEKPTAIRPTAFVPVSHEQLWPMMQFLSTSDNFYHSLSSTTGSLFTTDTNGSLILNNQGPLNPIFSTDASEGPRPSIYDEPPMLTAYGMEKDKTTSGRTKPMAGTVVRVREPSLPCTTVAIPAPDDPSVLSLHPEPLSKTSSKSSKILSEVQLQTSNRSYCRKKVVKKSKREEPREEMPTAVYEARGICARARDKAEKTDVVEMKAPLPERFGCPIKISGSIKELTAAKLAHCLSKRHLRVTEALNGSRSGRKVKYGRGPTYAKKKAEGDRQLAIRHERLLVFHEHLPNLDKCVVETANNEIFESKLDLILDTTQVLRSTVCKVAQVVDFPGGLSTKKEPPRNPHKKITIADEDRRTSGRISK